jgi:predicted RNase H-like nuclease (RuvC/YqgF family)
MDSKHLQHQIANNKANADQKRKQAQAMRINAEALYDDDGSNRDGARKTFLLQDASKFEREAEQLEQQMTQMQSQLDANAQKIAELQKKRNDKIAKHDQEIEQIDREIANLTGGMLI